MTRLKSTRGGPLNPFVTVLRYLTTEHSHRMVCMLHLIELAMDTYQRTPKRFSVYLHSKS